MIRKTRNVSLLISALILSTGAAWAQSGAFQDVLRTGPEAGYFNFILIAQRVGLAVPAFIGPCLNAGNPAGSNPPIIAPPGSGGSGSTTSGCPYFGPDAFITRAEAAYWVVRSQADENEISNFLCATGGDPSGMTGCNAGIPASRFADLGPGGSAIVSPFPSVSSSQLMRYIEVMARRGYTKGCGGTNDPVARFCPNDPINRADVALLVIRAKMSNVFPTSLSGVVSISPSPIGDSFSFPPVPFFTDVTPTDPVWGVFFPFVQKMRELGITVGTSPTTYSPGINISRKEMATFAVRAFFL